MKQMQSDLLTVLYESVIVSRPVREKMQLLSQWYESGYGLELDRMQSIQIMKGMGVPDYRIEIVFGELCTLMQEYKKFYDVRQSAVNRLHSESRPTQLCV